MTNLLSLTSAQLKQAAELKDQITTLEAELSTLLGSAPAKATKKFSAATKAKMAKAQQARWAKIKGPKTTAEPAKKKFTMSAAGRARIAAAAKARWAKVKAAKTAL